MNHPARPECLGKRQNLIRAATKAFMEEGYRVSIDRIAERAGVARQTIYNHFSSKEELFSEVAHFAAEDIVVSLDGDEGDIRERLLRFAKVLRQRALSKEGMAMFRTFSAEVLRLPTLGQAVFDKGQGQPASRLADFLARAMQDNYLRRDDPAFAAEMLMSMLLGFEHTRRLLCASRRIPGGEMNKVAKIVDCFLRAFAPEQ